MKAEKQKSREQKSRKAEKQESIEPGTHPKNQNLPRKKQKTTNSPPNTIIIGCYWVIMNS